MIDDTTLCREVAVKVKLTWTTYDGTPGTLPPEGKVVMLCVGVQYEAVHREGKCWMFGAPGQSGWLPIMEGHHWLRVPSIDQCKALENVLAVATGLETFYKDGLDITREDVRFLCSALAKLRELGVEL